jgi:predicted small secreted protein
MVFLASQQVFEVYFSKMLVRQHCTENFKHIFREMKLRFLVPNFYIHVSVSDLYIHTIGPRQTDRGNTVYTVYHSQIHDCGNRETEHYNFVLGITRPRSFISRNT